MSPFPPIRGGLSLLAKLRHVGGLEFVRTMLTPAADLGRARFGGAGPGLLLAGNAAHSDIPLDAPGSGLMGLLLVMLGQTVGYPVPEGGAGNLARALVRRLESRGGELRCSTRVTDIEVRADGRPGSGPRPARPSGRAGPWWPTYWPPRLYRELLPASAVPERVRRRLDAFQLDPGTVKVDWALDGPVPWASAPAKAPGTVHIADWIAEIAEHSGQVSAGLVSARPFLLMGQMTTSDPTRSPAGTESMWAYTHVPQRVVGDAGDEGITGAWDHSDCERFADRMQARVERLAPGFGERVLARRVLGPRRARGEEREPRRRCDQRRDLAAAPAAGVPPDPGLGTRRDRRTRPLPGVGLGSPGWRGARRSRDERRPRGAPARPAAAAATGALRLTAGSARPRRTPKGRRCAAGCRCRRHAGPRRGAWCWSGSSSAARARTTGPW